MEGISNAIYEIGERGFIVINGGLCPVVSCITAADGEVLKSVIYLQVPHNSQTKLIKVSVESVNL